MEEKVIMEYFDKKYGNSVPHRVLKLQEEVEELVVATSFMSVPPQGKLKDEILDEVSDVLAVITHLGHCLGKTSEELLNMSYDKNIIRETNPEYKHGKKY